MASLSPAYTPRPHLPAFFPEATPGLAQQHKLVRLMELRAVIDAMRYDRETQDPLLSWVVAQERTQNS